MKLGITLLLFSFSLGTICAGQGFENFTKMYDANYLVTTDPVSAKYIAIFQYTENVCRKTEYYMQEKQIKSITFFTDTSCKIKMDEFISYYPNKQIETKGFYQLNKKEGLWLSYYENGNKKDSAFYKKNNSCGMSIEWFENGAISVQRNMDTLGTGTGKEMGFWENGNKDYEGIWLNGKRIGSWVYYHFNGYKSLEAEYENNIMQQSKCYNEIGKEELVCDSNKIKGQIFKLAKNTTLKQYWEKGLNKISWNKDVPFYSSGVSAWIKFTVSKEGKVINSMIVHSNVTSINKALIELANNLPIIEPAYKYNRKINYTVTQKVNFKM